jgi:hypothetical protein
MAFDEESQEVFEKLSEAVARATFAKDRWLSYMILPHEQKRLAVTESADSAEDHLKAARHIMRHMEP